MEKKRIIICGDRHYKDYRRVEKSLREERELIDLCYVGGTKGVDKFGEQACRFLHIPFEVTEAKWRQEGLGAGPLRNQRQLVKLKSFAGIKEVWGFHDEIGKSVGTKDMLERAVQAGIPVRLYGLGGGWTTFPFSDTIVLCSKCGGEKQLPRLLAYKIQCKAEFHSTSGKSDESSDTF